MLASAAWPPCKCRFTHSSRPHFTPAFPQHFLGQSWVSLSYVYLYHQSHSKLDSLINANIPIFRSDKWPIAEQLKPGLMTCLHCQWTNSLWQRSRQQMIAWPHSWTRWRTLSRHGMTIRSNRSQLQKKGVIAKAPYLHWSLELIKVFSLVYCICGQALIG